MIIVRVARGITEHFPSRASEWALGIVLFNWGWMLLRPVSTFALSPSYAKMAAVASEDTWGVCCLAIGGLRILALIVNGTFRFFHHSPHIRSVMAFLSCFFWFTISIGLLAADVASTGLCVYPVLLLLDGYNAVRVAGDARHADEAARHARARA